MGPAMHRLLRTLGYQSGGRHQRGVGHQGPAQRPFLVAFACAGLLVSLAPEARAVDDTTRATLRQLGQAGVAAYQAGDYEASIEKLERAWNILPTSPSGLWLGRALEKSGRLVEASERYLAATRAEVDEAGVRAIQDKAREDAREAYDALQPRIPKLTVHVDGAAPDQVKITVKGRPLLADLLGTPVPVDPGVFDVVVQVGQQRKEKSVSLQEGAHQELRFNFSDVPTPRAANKEPKQEAQKETPRDGVRIQPLLGWLGVGLGAAGVATGGVAGGIAWAQYGKFDCTDKTCNEDPDDIHSYNTLRTVSTIGFAAGGVLLATGITLLVTTKRTPTTASLDPYLGPASLGVRGTF